MKLIKNIQKYVDSKLALLLIGFYTLFDLIHFLKGVYGRHLTQQPVESWFNLLVGDYLLDWLVVLGFMLIIAASTKNFIKRKIPWKKIFIIHITLSILIGVIIRIISDVYVLLIHDMSDYDIWTSINRFVYVIDLNFLIYFAMISIIYSYYYMKELRQTEIQKAHLQTRLVDMRMKMLTAQLQPHFLFNTLNCISSLIEFDGKKAQNTLVDLSQFLRDILHNSDSNMIRLGKELEILDHYLNILKVRFSEDLIIKKEIDAGLLEEKVPALLIQPIIENCIMHGYSYEHTDLVVTLKVFREGSFINIIVENDGVPLKMSNEPHLSGTGLSNIDERLRNMYKSNYVFQIRNRKSGKGVQSLIKIPLDRSAEEVKRKELRKKSS